MTCCYLLFVGCCSLVVDWLLLDYRRVCFSFVGCYVLFVVRWLFFVVVRCSLFVVC